MTSDHRTQAEAAANLGQLDPMTTARQGLLKRISREAGHVPADQLRNLATAYGILTDKAMVERYRPEMTSQPAPTRSAAS